MTDLDQIYEVMLQHLPLKRNGLKSIYKFILLTDSKLAKFNAMPKIKIRSDLAWVRSPYSDILIKRRLASVKWHEKVRAIGLLIVLILWWIIVDGIINNLRKLLS